MNYRNTVAAIIGCENNPDLVDKCLSRLSFLSEIYVSDLSTNNKIELLLKDKYPKAKHFYDTDRNLKNRHLKYQDIIQSDFLLIISPDEFYTDELIVEISALLKTDLSSIDAIGLRSVEYNYGTCFGVSAYFTYRYFRKGKLKYFKDNVHEEPLPTGKVIHLESCYEHHSNPILAVNAVKMFKFEMVNAEKLSTDELNRSALNKISQVAFLINVLVNWLRINKRFISTFLFYKKFGFGGLCYAYSSVIRTIAEHVSPTQELQYREGAVQRTDTRGYL